MMGMGKKKTLESQFYIVDFFSPNEMGDELSNWKGEGGGKSLINCSY